MNKLCQGCIVYRNRDFSKLPYESCGFVSLKAQAYCPCTHCLVKVVCRKRCNERVVEYSDRISKFVKEVGSDRYLQRV